MKKITLEYFLHNAFLLKVSQQGVQPQFASKNGFQKAKVRSGSFLDKAGGIRTFGRQVTPPENPSLLNYLNNSSKHMY